MDNSKSFTELYNKIYGCILGGAVGDAFGCPMECRDYRDIERIFGHIKDFKDIEDNIYKMKNEKYAPFQREMIGKVSDDTVLCDVLIRCIIQNNGKISAYEFAKQWETIDEAIKYEDGIEFIPLDGLHFLEKISFYRNKLIAIEKRELGHGSVQNTDAIMYIAPIGIICAGDMLEAELMAVDITSVHSYGRSRDVAGGFCAAIAACFIPGMSVDNIVQIAIDHIRDHFSTLKVKSIVSLSYDCKDCNEFIKRYYEEIIGKIIPYKDDNHINYNDLCVTWDCAEVLGIALATFIITKGENGEEMIRASACIGRDADTIARTAGCLIGAYKGVTAIPEGWAEYVKEKNMWMQLEEKALKLTQIVTDKLNDKINIYNKII